MIEMLMLQVGLELKDAGWKIIQEFRKNFPKTVRFLENFPEDFIVMVCPKLSHLSEIWLRVTPSEERSGKLELVVLRGKKEIDLENPFMEFAEGKEIVPRCDGGRFAIDKREEDENVFSQLENYARRQKALIDAVIDECEKIK